MKILILGSAPFAEVPAADHAYCANASAYYYADQLKGIPKVDCVVGAHIVCASPRSGAHDDLKKLRYYLTKSPISCLNVLDTKPWFLGWDLPASLLSVHDDTGLVPEVISSARRAAVLFKITGLKEPILSHYLWREINSFRLFLRAAKLLFHTCSHRFGTKLEISPVLTPSTGLWATIIAMERHGPGAEYVISGISLTTRNDRLPHPNGLRPGRYSKFAHHLQADKKVLNKLKSDYAIRYIPPGEHA